jgi:signal transduction histidine kinase
MYMLRPMPLAPYAMQPRGANAYLVVELHRTFLFEGLVPEIAERAFGENEEAPYDLAILETGPGAKPKVVYGPEALAAGAQEPDARADLLNERRPGPPEGGPPPGFERGGGRGGHGGRGRGFLLSPCGDVTGWELVVRHRAGSLSEEVRGYRARNLALSGAVLALLTCSFVLLTLVTGRAHKLAQMQMDFTAGVSHELRTPVAVIHSAADNLADGAVTGEASVVEYGRLIQRECRRLTEMVEETLQYAAVRAGRRRVEIQPVDTARVVREALRQTRPLVEEARMTVEESVAPDLPPVLADQAHLTRSVQNLLTNATKYAAGGGWIGVRAWGGERSGRPRVFIQVSDRGPGIAEHDLPLIFDPFYQGKVDGGVKGKGVGLGLSLARDIIRAMDGDISVDSEPGKGAAFTIDLPGAAA